MKEMLSNRRSKKLTKHMPLDLKILVLNIDEMEIKSEILKRTVLWKHFKKLFATSRISFHIKYK